MRSANLVIMGGIALIATSLAIYTAPVGARPLSHWAMSLGLFSSAALVSWLFTALTLLSTTNRTATQLIILLAYAISLASSTVAGASFGVIYHIIETTKVDFPTALSDGGIIIFVGYGLSGVVFLLGALLLKKQGSVVKVSENA